MTMAGRRVTSLIFAVTLLGASLLAGCNNKDEAVESFKGPGAAKAGAPSASMGSGGEAPKAAPPKAGGLGLEAPK
jgi:hypothetical protein